MDKYDKAKIYSNKYSNFEWILYEFLEDTYLEPEEAESYEDYHTIKKFFNERDEETIKQTIKEGKEVLKLDPFPWEWIRDITNRLVYDKNKDGGRDDPEAYKEWCKWIIKTIEEELEKKKKTAELGKTISTPIGCTMKEHVKKEEEDLKWSVNNDLELKGVKASVYFSREIATEASKECLRKNEAEIVNWFEKAMLGSYHPYIYMDLEQDVGKGIKKGGKQFLKRKGILMMLKKTEESAFSIFASFPIDQADFQYFFKKKYYYEKKYQNFLQILCYFFEDSYIDPKSKEGDFLSGNLIIESGGIKKLVRDDFRTIKRFCKDWDEKVLNLVINEGRRILKENPFPLEWIGSISDRSTYDYEKKEWVTNDEQVYKKWVKWIINKIEKEVKDIHTKNHNENEEKDSEK